MLGLRGVQCSTEKDNTRVETGNKIAFATIRSIKGLITSKNGSVIAKVKLNKVADTSNLKFNLLLLTKTIKN